MLIRGTAAAGGVAVTCDWVSICVALGLRLLSRSLFVFPAVSFSFVSKAKGGKSFGFCHQGVFAALEKSACLGLRGARIQVR